MITYLKNMSENDEANVYLFGAGVHGREISKSLSLLGIRYKGIFDNAYPDGGENGDISVLPLEVLYNNLDKKNICVIITCQHDDSIRKQLLGYGIKNIIGMRQLAMKYIPQYERLYFKISMAPEVSVLVTAYNGWSYTYACLKSLLENENKCSYEVILGDDCSTDETLYAEEYVEGIQIIHHPDNMQYLRNVNEIAKLAHGKYILLLANDVILNQKGYIDRMLRKMELDENIGILGGKLWVPLKNTYVVGRNFVHVDSLAPVKEDIEQNVEEIMPAAIMIKKEVWNRIGGYDEVFLPVYWEDLDLMVKVIREGYKIRYSPEFEATHFHGSSYEANSLGKESYKKNKIIFMERWRDYIENSR